MKISGNKIFMDLLISLLIVLTFMLINLGGHVHNTNSSLACPDWPLCFGKIMPEMTRGVLIEHTHRLLASFVGILTFLLLVLNFSTRLRGASMVAFFLVIGQATLGGITVIYKLPPAVSIAHLGVAMVFFCCLILIHEGQRGKIYSSSSLLKYTTLFLYMQILVGAYTRHSGVSTSCGLGIDNRLLCNGSLGLSSVPEFINMFHRLLGIVVAFLVFLNSASLLKKGKTFLGVFLGGLVVTQIWLGTEVISTGMRPFLTMLHLGTATAILGSIWKIQFRPQSS